MLVIQVFENIGLMFPREMSLWHFSIVKEESGKIPVKFGRKLMSNSLDNADIESVVVLGGWVAESGGVKSFLCWGFDNFSSPKQKT